MLLLVVGQWFDNLGIWVDSMWLSDLLHLALHHLVLISISHIVIIITDRRVCVLRSDLLFWFVVGKPYLLRLFSLIRVNLRLISLCGVIIANRSFQRVVVLWNNVLIVLVVACGSSDIRFLISVRISNTLIWYIVLRHNMLLRWLLFLWDLALLVSKWFSVSVVSWEGSLLTLLMNRALGVLHLLELLLVFGQHTFKVVTRHRAWAWITIA